MIFYDLVMEKAQTDMVTKILWAPTLLLGELGVDKGLAWLVGYYGFVLGTGLPLTYLAVKGMMELSFYIRDKKNERLQKEYEKEINRVCKEHGWK